MPIEVRLPAVADSIESAKFVSWLVRPGEKVSAGQIIAEVETDKATMEIEAPGGGVLGAIHVHAGTDGVRVGTLLAEIFEETESRSYATESASSPAAEKPPPALEAPSKHVERKAVVKGVPPIAVVAHAPAIRLNQEAAAATPLATRMAKLAALDLAEVASSHDGRITKADVERALGQRPSDASAHRDAPSASKAGADESAASPAGAFTSQPLTAMRRVTAQRLQDAKRTVPHFYLHAECRVDALMALRAQLNARVGATKLTVTDFVVYAAAQALRKLPVANSAWAETEVRIYNEIHIAIAVNTPKGLITPVIRRCDAKTLPAISQELRQLSERARLGQLRPEEYTGGTFTISNLGMFGVTSIVPIINTPQSCILGVGAIERRPVAIDERVVAGQVMTCTLAADHRAVDGAAGAELLGEIRRLLEDPVAMALHV